MRSFLLAPLFLLLALFVAAPCLAQLPKLDSLLKGLEEKSQFYGTVLVRRGGAKVFEGTYGFLDATATTKTTPGAVYYLNESSETFCTTLVMMAVDKGLMSLDAPIGTYVPEFKDQPGPRVRDLLSHSSGLGYPITKKLGKPRSFADIVALVAKDGLYYPPGSRFVMNLSDHTILGYALERMTGKPYTALLSEWILAPLGLRQTGMGRFPGDPGRLARIPAQERWDQEGARVQDSCSPDVGLYSTADDLAAFLDALAAGRLVEKDSFRLMQTGVLPDSKWTNGKGKIGLGLFVMASGACFNQGRWGVFDSEVNGYHALFFRDPRYDLTIILLANKWNPVPDDRALGIVVPAVYVDLGLAE